MNTRPKVILQNVSKRYILQQRKVDKLLELLSIKRNSKHFYALKNVSFTVNEGETIGIIGINGSGKSTLSNILAQVIPPTAGKLEINGETSLIAISVGLNNNLTGLENIELKCLMHGLKKDEIRKITPGIIEFADIGDFINEPVKSYSSGMKSRLGFAISVHTNPDILIIDEALSVGDQTFYEKCIKKMNDFKKEGKTIFFISHSISQVRSFCDKTMWMHYGELVEYGDTKEVTANYVKFIKYFNGLSEKEKVNYKKEKMTARQTDEFIDDSSKNRRARKVKKRRPKYRHVFEFTVLLALFIVSTFMMLFNNEGTKGAELLKRLDIGSAKGEMISNKEIVGKNESLGKKSSSEKVKEINKIGYIMTDKETVFQSKMLENKLLTLSFSSKVMVDKEIDGVLKIKAQNQNGYVRPNNVYIPKTPLEQTNFNINDYLQGLPKSFVDSYQYYLAFLNSDQETIEQKIRWKTGESVDESGIKYIEYGAVKYRMNKDSLSDAIIINKFVPQNVNIDELLESASLKSKDNKLIYVLTNTNDYIFNLKDNTLTITEGQAHIKS